MKKLFTLFTAALVVLSASAASLTPKMSLAPKAKKNAIATTTAKVEGMRELKPNAEKLKMHNKFIADKVMNTTTLDMHKAPAAKNELTIQISVDQVSATSVHLTFIPSDDAACYYLSVMSASDFNECTEAEIQALCKAEIEEEIAIFAQFGMSTNYEYFAYKGEKPGTYQYLEPETDYVAFAYFLDPETGDAVTGLTTTTFTTTSVAPTTNQISLTYNAETNSVSIKTTTNDSYIFWLETTDEFLSYHDPIDDENALAEMNDWVNTFENYGYTEYLLLTGDQEINCEEFFYEWYAKDMEDGEYIAMAVSFSDMINGDVTYKVFEYTAPEIPITENVELHIVAPDWSDYVAQQGWWQVLGYTADEEYMVSLSNLECEQAVGNYAIDEMDPDYTFVCFTATDKRVKFRTLEVSITEEEGMYIIKAEGDAKNGVHYTITFDAIDPTAVKGEDYDSEEDAESAFATEDITEFNVEPSKGYAYISCQTENEIMAILFYIEGSDLSAGTYAVNTTYGPGSVQPCVITSNSVYPSFWATTDENGYLNIPLFYFASGSVNVSYSESGELILDAEVKNTWGKSGKFTINAAANTIQSVNSQAVKNGKAMINGQLMISKEGKTYNAMGVEVK